MYSLVLMAAMNTAPQTAEFNGFFRDLFNCGGCGAARYSCGGCNGGCCGGCCGGFLGFGLFSRSGRYGCCGGCGCSGASYSCHGAAYSCYGGPVVSYTPVMNGGLTCHGGPAPSAPPPVFNPLPPMGVPGGVPGGVPYAPPSPAPAAVAPDRFGLRPAGFEAAATPVAAGQGARATVVVRLPIDAQLYADNTALRLTGTERRFVTPELPAGQEYTYRFKAEYERGGEVVSVTKRVAVRAGGTATIEFVDLTTGRKNTEPAGTTVSNPGAPANPTPPATNPEPPAAPAAAPANPAADRATITVKLPPGATLYVDDRKSPSDEPVRQFSTPPLPSGREFAYLLKAEVVRDGRPESLIQKVPFRAGERVTVDFTGITR